MGASPAGDERQGVREEVKPLVEVHFPFAQVNKAERIKVMIEVRPVLPPGSSIFILVDKTGGRMSSYRNPRNTTLFGFIIEDAMEHYLHRQGI